MNKIKDFIYDKNDLLVALAIVALAALIIVFRVDTIMAYPSSKGESKPPVSEVKPPINEDTSMGGSIEDDDQDQDLDQEGDDQEGEAGQGGEQEGQENDDQSQGEETPPDNKVEGEGLVSIYIESGSTGSDIARLLVNAGLVETREDFYNAVREAGADTKLKAGNFKIPAKASPSEIVQIITK